MVFGKGAREGTAGSPRTEIRADAILFAESDHLVLEVVVRSRSARPRSDIVIHPEVVRGAFRLRTEEARVRTLAPRGVATVAFDLDPVGDSSSVEASGAVRMRDGNRDVSLAIPAVSLDLSFGPLRPSGTSSEDLAEAASRFFSGTASFRSVGSTRETFETVRKSLRALRMAEVDAIEGPGPAHGRASFHATDERGRRYAARVVVSPAGSGCNVRLLAFVSDEPTLFGFLQAARNALGATLRGDHQP